MEIKDLEKCAQHLSRIRELDAKIIEIEKLAMQVSQGHCESAFSISIINQKQETMATMEDPHDDILDWMRQEHRRIMGLVTYSGQNNSGIKQDKTSISECMTENETMHMLSFFLDKRKRERQFIMNQLSKIGIKI